MRARHEAIWNDRPTSRCKAGCVAIIDFDIRSTYGQIRRSQALDRVSMGINFGSTTTGPGRSR
jgi:hypothetical protein